MTSKENFVWLGLRPQQKFKDDDQNRIFDIIGHASEFAYFVFRDSGAMRIVVRTTESNQNLFTTIPGISAEQIEAPRFDKMLSKYLVLQNRRLIAPLLDLKTVTKSNAYQKMWAEKRVCMMACFICDQTKKISSEIERKIKTLEGIKDRKGSPLSGRKKEDLAAAVQKRDGHHGYYNCTIVFGVQTAAPELSELREQRGARRDEEEEIFQSKKEELKSLDKKEFGQEYKKLKESYDELIRGIDDDFESKDDNARSDIREAKKALDRIIGNVLHNKFAHRIARRRVKFSSEEKRFRQKLAEAFGMSTINPYTFVPEKPYSKSMVLTEIELAYFISFPQEYDIQTINFDTGPTPTFVHGRTEEVEETDLAIQCIHQATPEDTNRLNSSASRLRVICTKCDKPVWIKKDDKGGYTVDMA